MASGLTEAGDLIVEDGTGKDDANSYATIAEALAYGNVRQSEFLLRFKETDESNQVAALILATEYVDLRWNYIGNISVEDAGSGFPQALSWPRNNGGFKIRDARDIDVTDTVPNQIVEATIEYAGRSLDECGDAQALFVDPSVPDSAGRFETLAREKIGPLEEEHRFSDTRGTTSTRKYITPDRIIKRSGLLSGSGAEQVRRQ